MSVKIKFVIFIFLFLFVQNKSIAQNNQIKKSSSKYYYNSRIYSRKELNNIIKESPIAYDSYLKGIKKIKRTSQYALLSGFCLGVGYVVNNKEPATAFGAILKLGTDASLYIFNLDDHYEDVRNVFVGSGIILGIVAIVEYKLGGDLVSDSIVKFNHNNENSSGHLEFGIHGNGFGLNYTF